MPAPWVEALLESLRSNRAMSGLVGAGIGAGAGAVLNDQDPTTSAIGGGVMGGVAGLLAGGRPNIHQMIPMDSALMSDITHRFGAKPIDPPSELGALDRFKANLVDTREPAYFNSPEVEQQASNLVHGGMSEAKLLQGDLGNELHPLVQDGLRNEVQDFLGHSVVDRLYDTVTRNQQRAYQGMTTALGLGQHDTYATHKAEYDRLTNAINSRTVAPNGMDPAQVQMARAAQLERLGPENFARVHGFASKFMDVLEQQMDHAAARGEVDAEFYKDITDQRKRGIRYFPALRDLRQMDPVSGKLYRESPEGSSLLGRSADLLDLAQQRGLSTGGSGDFLGNAVSGSNAPLQSPLDQGMWTVQELVRRSKQNDAMKTFVNGAFALAPPRNDGSAFIRELQPHENLGFGEGAVQLIHDGVTRRFAAPVEWTDLLNLADSQAVGTGLKVMGKAMRLNSMMLTGMNAAFMARNVPRDLWDAAMLTRMNPRDMKNFLVYWGKAFNESLHGNIQDPLARDAFKEGAVGTTISRQLGTQPEWMRASGAPETALGTLASRLQNFTGATEDATKIAAYKVGLDRGMTPSEAAFRSRRYAGSPDFQRQGKMTAGLRPWLQFWNPQIQGIARNIERAREDPAYMAQWMGLLGAGYLGLDAYNRSFKNPATGRPWIEDVPDYDRQNNLLIVDPTGGVQTFSNGVQRPMMLKIPLGHLARILLAPVMSASQHLHGDPNAPSAAQTFSNTFSQMLPLPGNIDTKAPVRSTLLNVASMANPVIRIPVEQRANRNAYTDTPIVGARLQGLDADRQFTEDTSPIARKLGGLTGASPERLEHILRNLIPGVGNQVLAALDLTGRQERPGVEWAQKVPFAGGIISGLTEGSVSADRQRMSEGIYDLYNKSQSTKRTFNDMIGREAPPEETDKYLAQNEGVMASEKSVNSIVGFLSQLSKEREMVLRDPGLTAHQRTKQLQEIEADRMDLLRGSMPIIDMAKGK